MSNEQKTPDSLEGTSNAEGELADDDLDKVSGGMVIEGGTTALTIKQRSTTVGTVDDAEIIVGPSPHM